MKWSEQMRELFSVDENFNQLKMDLGREELFINEEFIAKPVKGYIPNVAGSATFVVSYEDYNKIIKKYPFFTDVKFLLNCIFRTDFYFIKAKEIYYYEYYIVIQSGNSTSALVIYTAPRQ